MKKTPPTHHQRYVMQPQDMVDVIQVHIQLAIQVGADQCAQLRSDFLFTYLLMRATGASHEVAEEKALDELSQPQEEDDFMLCDK